VGDIEVVTCDVPVEVIDIIAEPWAARQRPVQAHEARWSLPYVVAASLMGRKPMPDLFMGPGDTGIFAVAQRVEYRPWTDSAFPDRYPARLTVCTTSGVERVVEIDDVRGGSRRPMAAAAVVDKATWCFDAGGMSSSDCEAILDEMLSAADPDVSRISRALRS
jgi:2-methylcitrate dehydratase PrpD